MPWHIHPSADVYSVLPFFGGILPRTPKSSAAAREALRLDPGQASFLRHSRQQRNGIRLGILLVARPNSGRPLHSIPTMPPPPVVRREPRHDRWAESGRSVGIDQAHLLDPTSPIIRRVKGSVLVAARRLRRRPCGLPAVACGEPTYILAHDCLGYAYWGKGMYSEVIEQ